MPAIRRLIKKTTYALGFGLVLTLFLALIIIPRLNLGAKQPDPTPPPSPITIEGIESVLHANSVDIVARLRNPNPRAGIPDYPVTFVLYDDNDQPIIRLERSVYLLPGSLNYVAVLDVKLAASLKRIELDVPNDPIFATIPDVIGAPSFNSFLRERALRTIGSREVEVQKGIVTNTSTAGYRRVDITGVAFDAEGNIVGVGQSFIGNLAVGEQREFTVQWPAPASVTERVIILPSTNVFDRENILEIVGDPDLLR